MSSAIIIEDWDSDGFHRKVLEMEAAGYVAREETYRITPIMNPETGYISHVYRIEMYRPDAEDDLKSQT
ncbi:MAG TPA: hypothetical protein VNN73_01970 [Blastocatellia bacterium]|nr:hypothetical protein [Blastocatellia bacterium]